MSTRDPAAAAKSALRDSARSARAALGPAERAAASARITAHCLAHPLVARARAVFVYVSTAEEVATRELIARLGTAGRRVLIPRVANRRTMLAHPFPGWDALVPGVLGIPAPPPGPAFTGPIDVALVPGLAFTAAGARLGYGGGYYDRWLAEHPVTVPIAIAFAIQLTADLPVTERDVPMAGIVTEHGFAACRPAP